MREVPIGFRLEPATGLLATEASELRAFSAGKGGARCIRLVVDLSLEPAVIAGNGERRARSRRRIIAVVEGSPLGAAIEVVCLDDEPAVRTDELALLRPDRAATVGTRVSRGRYRVSPSWGVRSVVAIV